MATSVESRFAQRLHRLREVRAWSLDELARRSGVSRATISKVERQQSKPTATLCARPAEALGATPTSPMGDHARPGHAAARRDAQRRWTDSQTWYQRRMASPPGALSDVEVVAIDLPAGAEVHFDAVQSDTRGERIRLLQGSLVIDVDGSRVDLAPGDCARVAVEMAHGYRNPGAVKAHDLVIGRSTRAGA